MLPSVCMRERKRHTERHREKIFACMFIEDFDGINCLEKEELVGWRQRWKKDISQVFRIPLLPFEF